MQTDFFQSLESTECKDCYINQLNILDNIPDPIFIKDQNHHFVYVNKALCEMTLYAKEELLGKCDADFFPKKDAEFYVKTDKEVLRSGFDNLNEENLADKSGNTYKVLTHKRALKIGDSTYVIGSITDISLRSALEKELVKLTDSLEEAVKEESLKRLEQQRLLIQQSKLAAMGEMIGAIAHQWRQPLTIVGATLSMVQIKSEMDMLKKDDLKVMVSEMEEQIQLMSSTINDFMNFFKPDKQKRQFNLLGAFENVLKLLKAHLKSKQIKVEYDIDEKIKIAGYKGQLEQVILNVISNAKDALSESKSGDKHINIHISEYSWKWDLIIEDNGGGIDEHIIDRVFEPYFSTKEEGKGSGIGLYMSKMIMQNSFEGDLVAQNFTNERGQRCARFIICIKK